MLFLFSFLPVLEEGPVIKCHCLTWQLKRARELLILSHNYQLSQSPMLCCVSPRSEICSGCLTCLSFWLGINSIVQRFNLFLDTLDAFGERRHLPRHSSYHAITQLNLNLTFTTSLLILHNCYFYKKHFTLRQSYIKVPCLKKGVVAQS